MKRLSLLIPVLSLFTFACADEPSYEFDPAIAGNWTLTTSFPRYSDQSIKQATFNLGIRLLERDYADLDVNVSCLYDDGLMLRPTRPLYLTATPHRFEHGDIAFEAHTIVGAGNSTAATAPDGRSCGVRVEDGDWLTYQFTGDMLALLPTSSESEKATTLGFMRNGYFRDSFSRAQTPAP